MKTSKQIYSGMYKSALEGKTNFKSPAENLIRIVNIFKIGKKEQGSTVLDFGCGDGRHAHYFSNLGFSVTAMDVSQEAIDATKMRDLPDIRYQLVDANSLPNDFGKKFDVILCWETINWVGNSERVLNLLSSFAKAITDTGHVILTFPSEDDFTVKSAKKMQNDLIECTYASRAGAIMFAPELPRLKTILEAHFNIEALFSYKVGWAIYNQSVKAMDPMPSNIQEMFSNYAFVLTKK